MSTDYSYMLRGSFGPKAPAAVGKIRMSNRFFVRTRSSWARIERDEAEALYASLRDLFEPVPYEVV